MYTLVGCSDAPRRFTPCCRCALVRCAEPRLCCRCPRSTRFVVTLPKTAWHLAAVCILHIAPAPGSSSHGPMARLRLSHGLAYSAAMFMFSLFRCISSLYLPRSIPRILSLPIQLFSLASICAIPHPFHHFCRLYGW